MEWCIFLDRTRGWLCASFMLVHSDKSTCSLCATVDSGHKLYQITNNPVHRSVVDVYVSELYSNNILSNMSNTHSNAAHHGKLLIFCSTNILNESFS